MQHDAQKQTEIRARLQLTQDVERYIELKFIEIFPRSPSGVDYGLSKKVKEVYRYQKYCRTSKEKKTR